MGVKLQEGHMVRILIIFTVTLLLSSCSGPIYIYLYNNTTGTIQASTENEKIEVIPGNNKYIKVVNQFTLCVGDQKYQYLTYDNLPPGKYYGLEHFPLHSIHFQVEEDGLLYLLMADEPLPSKLQKQPKGFPVTPKKTGKCKLTSSALLSTDV